ncbi:hypothetical protein JOF29_000223 [Kribbella aluminosa]|uniref:Uncharacterized protein n=1 Tax=Kribbella aluminosa TaxID=416017 RepID=A0ABS4UC32_9ACTN|nr:hypothetical protein [Kribbella aluminosa]MBP2349140.1 hypothetical protein [Kribbella aluminosa]
MIEFIADFHGIIDWEEMQGPAPIMLVQVDGFVDEQGPQLSLVIHDRTVLGHDGKPRERICFSVNEADQIAAFFRSVDEARRALPPNIVD